MIKNNILFFILFLSLCIPYGYAETNPSELQKKIENSIESGRASQAKADDWARERESYLNEIRELKNRKRWLTHQKEKHQTYLLKQLEIISELENRKKDTEKIKISLEPSLDEWFTKLEAFVKKDLPFLPEERERRLRFLKDSLNDYHLGLDEKTRRLFESLQAEAGYGVNVEKSEGTVQLKTGPAQVNLFRLGRVALFYLSLDRKEGGWFNPKTGAWEALPEKYNRVISAAIEIAEKKRTPELLELPIGKVK